LKIINNNKYILENQIELNNPAFLNITFSDSYGSIPESWGWRVAIGFQKPNDSNWWEMETDWAWLPEALRLRVFPSGLIASLLL
jgi:hypothetical protein